MSYFQLCVHVEVLKEKMMQSTMEAGLGGVADWPEGHCVWANCLQLWPRWTHIYMKHMLT